jgi:hypothetical protein
MNRRQFIANIGISCASSAWLVETSQAYNRCGMMTPMGQACEAGVNMSRLPTFYAFQQMPEWCWAASISMIFKYYGYDVSQDQIVQAVYGSVVNFPAMSGGTISSQLNRTWTDRNGRRFRSSMQGLFDADAGIGALNNMMIVDSLAQERPLLLGNITHAVVLTAVSYFATPMGPNVTNIGVLDPWPGIGMRGAQSPAELVPMPQGALRYLALPQIQSA